MVKKFTQTCFGCLQKEGCFDYVNNQRKDDMERKEKCRNDD